MCGRSAVWDRITAAAPRTAGALLYLAVVVSPLVALLAFGGEAPEVSLIPGMRRLGLLGKSVLLAGTVAAAAMVLGTLVASVLWSWQEPPYRQLRWLVLAFAVIPAYIHALAWTTGAGAVTRFLATLGLPEVGLSGWFGCAVVQTMTYLPFAVGLGLLGLEAVDRKLVDAARTQRPAESVFGRVVLPLALPMLAGGAALIFVLSITDYSLPLLFQRNVYALEIFAEYSAGTTPLSTLIIAWPLLAATVLVLVASQAGLRQLVLRRGDSRDRPPSAFEWPTWFVFLQVVACGLLLVHLVLPLVVLAGQVSSWQNLSSALSTAHSELVTSMATAVVVAVASVFVGLGPAVLLARRSANSGLWWLAVLVPLAVPAPLVGIGLVALWNRAMMIDAYGTSLMLVLAALARFVPIATIVFVAQLRRIQPLLFDAARVFQVGRGQGMIRVWLPLVAPGLVAGACFTFALALGELGATIIVAPPGQATLAIRIYNLLHYGATELIAGLCLFVLFVCLGAVVLALAVLGGAGRGLFSLTREWGVGT